MKVGISLVCFDSPVYSLQLVATRVYSISAFIPLETELSSNVYYIYMYINIYIFTSV